MAEVILRVQTTSLVLSLVSGVWYLAIWWRARRTGGDMRDALGFIPAAEWALWAAFVLAVGLLRRNAELEGIDASWLLNAPVQLAIYAVPILIILHKVWALTRDRRVLRAVVLATIALLAWPEPVLYCFSVVYPLIAGPR